MKHLDDMTDEAVLNLNIPTGVPLVYELDDQLRPVKKYYLLDEEEVKVGLRPCWLAAASPSRPLADADCT